MKTNFTENKFIEEVVEFLEDNGKTKQDVLWCGSEKFWYFSLDELFEIAPKVHYDDGFWGQEIAKDLLIVWEDFWLERWEYDWSEWWEFKQMPKRPDTYNKPVTIRNWDSWATLEEMNRPGWKWGE